VPVSRTAQRERTRAILLDAAMMSLVEDGYAGTTTQRVQDRAGVSRGALLHHFGSKAELFVAATHHIADRRLARVREIAEQAHSSSDARRQVIQAIRDAMTGPPFQAAMELWAASRTDPELRAALLPAERRLGSALRELFDAFVQIDDPDLARVRYESLLALLRGLELTRIMKREAVVADLVVEQWLADLDAWEAARRR
jgi:AcrR family transcriptional regulator